MGYSKGTGLELGAACSHGRLKSECRPALASLEPGTRGPVPILPGPVVGTKPSSIFALRLYESW